MARGSPVAYLDQQQPVAPTGDQVDLPPGDAYVSIRYLPPFEREIGRSHLLGRGAETQAKFAMG